MHSVEMRGFLPVKKTIDKMEISRKESRGYKTSEITQ